MAKKKERDLEKLEWRRVEAPRAWRPKQTGEVLLGYYAGRSKRSGGYGQYDVVLILVPGDGVKMVSGVKVIQLFDAAIVEPGDPVRLIYGGEEKLPSDKTMKLFELYVTDGDKLPLTDFPAIQEPS